MQLYTKIFIGMIAGLALGLAARWLGTLGPSWASGIDGLTVQVVDPIGNLFIQAIKFVVVPLVFSSLVVGITGLGDVRKLGRLGGKAMGFFVMTSAIAVLIALGVGNLMHPGDSFGGEARQQLIDSQKSVLEGKLALAPKAAPPLLQQLVAIIPANPLQAAAETQMLPLIVTGILFGVAMTMIRRQDAEPLQKVFMSLNEVMLALVGLVMKLAPLSVAALIFAVVVRLGLDILVSLLYFTVTVLIAFAAHLLITYMPSIRFLAGMGPVDFLNRIAPVFQVAFSTSSSSATLPTSMKYAEERLGVPRNVSSFVLPMGATVNMDGTAMYQVVAGLFVAQLYGIDLSIGQQLSFAAMAAVASIGAAGVPGGSIPLMAGVFASVGIPVEGIAIVLGMDRLLDMCRTTLNVTGDLVCCTFVAGNERAVPAVEPASV